MPELKFGKFGLDPDNWSFRLEGVFDGAKISFVTVSVGKQIRYTLPNGLPPQQKEGGVALQSDGLHIPPVLGEGGMRQSYTMRAIDAVLRQRGWAHQGLPPGADGAPLGGMVTLTETPSGFDAAMKFWLDEGIRANILYISNLPKDTEIIAPAMGGISVKNIPADGLLIYEYPLPFYWAHQFIILQRDNAGFWVYCDEYPVRKKRLIISNADREAGLSISIVSEADAPFAVSEYASPTFHVEAFSSGWTVPASKYKAMLQKRFNLKRYEDRTDFPAWAKDICLYVELRGVHWGGLVVHTFDHMRSRMDEIVELIDPRHVMLYLAGWDDWYDIQNPEYQPAPELGGETGFRQMVDYAHQLGFKVCPYVNAIAMNIQHPLWEKFKDHRLRASDGSPIGWSIDLDGDGVMEAKTGYISLNCEEWRELIVSAVKRLSDYGCDAVMLDQLCHFYNTAGENLNEGIAALFKRLKEELPPHFLVTAEAISEHFLGYVANAFEFANVSAGAEPNTEPLTYRHLSFTRTHPIVKFILNDFVRSWGHVCMGQPGDNIFVFRNALNVELGHLPIIALPRYGPKIRDFPQFLESLQRAKDIASGRERLTFRG